MSIGNSIAELFEAAVADAVALTTGTPPTALAAKSFSLSFREYHAKRNKYATAILIAELRSGTKTTADLDVDNLFALVAQYQNAVNIGAATRNLKLLAQLVVNGSTKPIPFQPDEVASISRYIAELDPEELQFLAELQRQTVNFASYAEGEENKKIAINTMLEKELVPKIFADKSELMMVATSLQRTGLVMLSSAWGGDRIDASARFHKLVKLVDLQSALRTDD
jgi:hypothetical protein